MIDNKSQKLDKTIRKITLIISISLYVFSLTQTGFIDSIEPGAGHGDGGGQKGIFLLIFGWLLVFSGGAGLTWLANPALWYSWITIKRLKYSSIGSTVAFFLSSLFIAFNTINDGGEAGLSDYQSMSIDTKIESYELGYFLWLSSTLILVIGNFIRFWINEELRELK